MNQSLPNDVIIEKINKRGEEIEEEIRLKDLENKMNQYKVVETFKNLMKKNEFYVVVAFDKKSNNEENYENLLKESLKIQIKLNEIELMKD